MEAQVILLAILVILFWGAWGFFYKIGIDKIGIWPALLWSSVAYTAFNAIIIIILYTKAVPVQFSYGSGIICVGALIGTVGAIIWYFMLQKAPVSVVIPLTALYPAITILLGVLILGENIKLVNALGILLALVAGILLAL